MVLDSCKTNKDERKIVLVNSIPISSDISIGYRAQDGLGNFFRFKVQNRLFHKDTSYDFLLSKWHQMGVIKTVGETLVLIKNQSKWLQIDSTKYKEISDRYLDSLDNVTTWERDYKIAKVYGDYTFNVVSCFSDKDILIAGNNNKNECILLVTHDGGRKWTIEPTYDMKIVSVNTYYDEGLIFGNSTYDNSGIIYKTSDRGKTFIRQRSPNVNYISSCFGDLTFNKYYAIASVVGSISPKMIVIDFNAINSLTSVELPNIPNFNSISANAGNQIYITGITSDVNEHLIGELYTSRKLGQNSFLPWDKQTSTDFPLTCCYSIMNTNGIDLVLALKGESIIRSENGGVTWKTAQSVKTNFLRQVCSNFSLLNFDKESPDFYVIGDKGTILYSRDFGTHWEAENGGTSNDLTAISANEITKSNQTILSLKQSKLFCAVGEKGTVLYKKIKQ